MKDRAITDKERAFAQEVILLARKHGLGSFSGEFRVHEPWPNCYIGPTITITWSIGRHHEKNDIHLGWKEMEVVPEPEWRCGEG
jgi:hypothetical protein